MSSPNILFLMTDQMQGRVLEPDNPCQTPNLDRLAARGMRFRRAYTPNAVCSPARASLMTGLLPHNHGVLFVEHTVDADQAVLRSQHPHFAVSAGSSKARSPNARTGASPVSRSSATWTARPAIIPTASTASVICRPANAA